MTEVDSPTEIDRLKAALKKADAILTQVLNPPFKRATLAYVMDARTVIRTALRGEKA